MTKNNILIVEDEPIIAMEISERLQQCGYSIAGISPNSKDALTKFNNGNIDLILLDISLRGEQNGIEFAEIVRQSSDVPIIYLTAYSDDETIAKAKLTQPSAFIKKPFNLKDLETSIDLTLYKYEMEHKLKENEQLLNHTLNGISDAIITTNKSGLINYTNASAEQLTGYTKEEMIGRRIDTVLTFLNDSNSSFIRDKNQFKSQIDNNSYKELAFVNKQSKKIFVEFKSTQLIDEFGRLTGLVYVLRDLSMEKRFIAELNKSQIRYKTVIEQINDGIIIYDFKTKKILETNKAYQKMSGYSETELKELTFYDLVQANDIPTHVIDYEIKKHKHLFLKDHAHKRKDETVFDVEVSSNLVEFDGNELIVVVVRDISERKQSEAIIRTSEEILRTLFDTMDQGIIYQNSSGIIQNANNAASKILGHSLHDLLGKKGTSFNWNFIDEDGNTLSIEKNPIYIATKYNRQITCQTVKVFNKDENCYKWISISCVPHLKNGHESNSAIFITFTDITDLKNSEEALKKYGEELKHVIATKDKFFSIVAHDLKSPFLGLLGFTSVLCEDFDQFELDQIKKYINSINTATRNLYGLIQNLLEWSRLQTNKLELNITEVDISQIANYAINLFSTNCAKKNIIITNSIPAETFVIGDERILDSVFSNLLSNAIKFSSRNSKILLSSKKINNAIEVCVEDNGTGMDENRVKELFNMEITTSSKGTEGEIGTGLGLVLCRELIEKINGSIRVESELGKGSKFYFTVPLAKDVIA